MTLDLNLAGLQLADAAAVFDAGWHAGWQVREPLTVSEWTARYRMLPSESSAEHGRWRNERTPFLVEIMDALSADSPVQSVAFMKSTQVGGTEVILNWIGYVVDHNPGPMMVVQPTQKAGREWCVQRFDPMVALVPELSGNVVSSRVRDGSTTTLKRFDAGFLFIASAGAIDDLRSKPIRDAALDEVDQYEEDLDGQGSPIELVERRQSTFRRRKLLLVSSPTEKDHSLIEAAWLAGDQRNYHVPCPHCGHAQPLVIEQLTDAGEYLCAGPECGALIEERHKPNMLAAGRWVSTFPERRARSYHINALYTPIGLGYAWREIADMRAKALGDPIREKHFANTILGLPWSSAGERLEAQQLAERAERWTRGTVPRGALVITTAIDVQANRWEVLICGWGRGDRCWVIDYVVVPGDPTREEEWASLDAVVFAPLQNAAGQSMRAARIAIDSGHFTDHVYRWVRKHQAAGVVAIKGAKEAAAPVISRPKRTDHTAKGKSFRAGVMLWHVGVNTTKTTLFSWLTADARREPEDRQIHFPGDMPAELYQHLTAEVFDVSERRWVKKPGVRNEAWDCLQYAYAMTHHPMVRLYAYRDADWVALEAKLLPATDDLFGATPAPPRRAEPAPAPAPAAPAASTIEPAAPKTESSWIQPRRGPWIDPRRR